jgi:hypothetical protein
MKITVAWCHPLGAFARIAEFTYYLRHVKVQVKVKVILRLTVSQSVCLGVEPRLGLMTRYLGLF